MSKLVTRCPSRVCGFRWTQVRQVSKDDLDVQHLNLRVELHRLSKGRVLLINNETSGTWHVILVQIFDVQPHVVTGKSAPHADGTFRSQHNFLQI